MAKPGKSNPNSLGIASKDAPKSFAIATNSPKHIAELLEITGACNISGAISQEVLDMKRGQTPLVSTHS